MESRVTFKIQWSEENKDRNVKILCGNVEGAGLPVPTYLAILKAISQVEAELNTKPQPEPLVPEEGVESAGREIEEAIKREGDLPVKLKRLVPDAPPPTPKHFCPSPPPPMRRK